MRQKSAMPACFDRFHNPHERRLSIFFSLDNRAVQQSLKVVQMLFQTFQTWDRKLPVLPLSWSKNCPKGRAFSGERRKDFSAAAELSTVTVLN